MIRRFAVGAFVGSLALAWSRAAAAGDDVCSYEVVAGDTLSRIASRHHVDERDLIAANPELAKDPDRLRVGQALDICRAKKISRPGAESAERRERSSAPRCGNGGRLLDHEVAAGETLSKIAKNYRVSESAIVERNPSLQADPDRLRAGQEIKVCVAASKIHNDAACNHETALFHHEVIPGEHLGQIAGRYGVRRQDLVDLNDALRSDPDRLRVGQDIRVCPLIAPREREAIDYRVQSGDTVGSIAIEHGLSPSELVRYQQGRLEDPNALKLGQTLTIWVDGSIVRGYAEVNDDAGVLAGGMQLPLGSHYVVKWQAAAWGTAKTIRNIQSAIASYQRKVPGGPKVHVGDISKRGGGRFPPHISHQHGRDVDVGYVLKGSDANTVKFRTATAKNFDVARSWALIKAFTDTQDVVYIFVDYRLQERLYEYAREHGVSEDTLDELFQYPRGRGRSHGLIRHWKGHANHFHVRFRK